MPFEPLLQTPGVQTNWNVVTHIRLVKGVRPDSGHAIARWEQLLKLADANGIVPVSVAVAKLEPVRNLPSGREASIKQGLRNWSNPRDHGNNSQDKGWLQLGRMT